MNYGLHGPSYMVALHTSKEWSHQYYYINNLKESIRIITPPYTPRAYFQVLKILFTDNIRQAAATQRNGYKHTRHRLSHPHLQTSTQHHGTATPTGHLLSYTHLQTAWYTNLNHAVRMVYRSQSRSPHGIQISITQSSWYTDLNHAVLMASLT